MKRIKPPAIELPNLSSPVHLVTVKISGRAVPWSVPDIGRDRKGRVWANKERRLVAWQKTIASEAQYAWGYGRPAYPGPVALNFWFYIGEPRGRQQTADLTNLVKSAEDALQGVVIANDKRVCAIHSERYEVASGEPQRVFIQAWAMPTTHRIEPIDPGPFAFRSWEWPYTQRAV